MKKVFLLALIVLAFSCKKEGKITPNVNNISVYHDEFGTFKKELLVYDQSGQNSILLLIHSDINGAIEYYLDHNKLKLMLEVDNKDNNLKSAMVRNIDSDNATKATIPDEILKRQVSVELITENIKENVKNYYLSVKSKDNQLKVDFIFDANYCISYRTTGDFLGVSNFGAFSSEDKYMIYCYLEKTNSALSGWNVLWQGFLQGDVVDSYYWAHIDYTSTGNPYYKILTLLYTDPRVPSYNFLIAYSKSSFYGHSCTIGSYDSRNCYVGAAPTGTNAFINYNPVNGDVYLYYTPLPGNVCPIGLGFDGQNCAFQKVPSNCVPFISSNN